MTWSRVAAAALVLLSADAQAQQLDFRRVSRTGDEMLTFVWRDLERREQATAFTLTRDAIRQAEASFRDFSLEEMWRVLERELRDEVAGFGDGARVELRRSGDTMSWTLSARDQRATDELSRRVEGRLTRAQQAYLSRHLRRRVGDRRIVVDFAAAVAALQESLRPVARALGRTSGIADNDAARVDLALTFFQQIPYAALDDAKRRGGDFLPGPALLAQNRGDCDSKAVALAAVLRSYTSGRRLAVVTMPGHAVLGVEMPASVGQATVRAQGRQYVALEVAGPAVLPAGKLAAQSAKQLAEGREIEIWPLN
ncbi:MAG: hypothetical protein KIT25_16455 [Enhydrobacter sp.]|nr:MAG: hypothetical protein KIT25_16455 [Enhydrobacter sp.]